MKKKVDELNALRSRSLRAYLTYILMVLFLGVSVIVVTWSPPLIVFIGFLSFILITLGYQLFMLKYQRKFKQKLIPMAFAEWAGDIVYQEKGIEKDFVNSLKLFGRFNQFKSEDRITGVKKGVSFDVCDVRIGYYSGSGKSRSYTPICHGQFYLFDFNKPFRANIIMREKNRGCPSGYELVKLESEAFNKCFYTYTTDELGCFYVLTPHFMERLMALESAHPGDLFLAFQNNRLYLGIHNKQNRYEASLFSEVNPEQLKNEMKRDLSAIASIIDALSLDQSVFER